jgi:DUF4097 and DUF4098 domain-containing protein YvlB
MRNRLLTVCITAFSLLLLAGCDWEDFGPSDRYQSDFHYNYPLKPGGKLEMENFNGSIEITSWDRNAVDISGTKYASSEQMRDAIKIDITPSDTSIYVRTIRPSERHGNLGARYVVKVPRKIELGRIVSSNGGIKISDVEGAAHLRTSNGSIRLMKLIGQVDAQTSNGPIEVEDVSGGTNLRTTNGRVRADAIQGPFEANTSNGGIHVHLASLPTGTPLRLGTTNGGIDLTLDAPAKSDIRATTSNGPITMHLPADMGARLRAATSNSGITTDFEVRTEGSLSKHHLDGTIGSGGPLLDLSTTNGHISLLKM